ncbi:MAG: GntR family transcriptional regulator [Victivallaceae bacterium]
MTNYKSNETELFPLRKEPLYKQVKKALRVYMSNTTSKVLPTENELQRIFNVSRITVRRALKELEDDGRLKTVQGSGRVVVPPAKQPRTGYVGIVQGEGIAEYQQELIHAVDMCLKKRRITTALNIIDRRFDDIEESLAAFIKKVDGLIFCGFTITGSNVYDIVKDCLPSCVILEDDCSLDYPMNLVQGDRFAGFEKIAAHLKSLGHENIAFIGTASDQMRIGGIEKGLGKTLDPELIINAVGWRHTAYIAAEELLMKKKPFSAVICNSDTCALGVMDRLLEAGIKIPDEVSVTGYDNIISSKYCLIPLTTAAAPKIKLAERAVELILQTPETVDNDGSPAKILIEPELEIRASTGKPPR